MKQTIEVETVRAVVRSAAPDGDGGYTVRLACDGGDAPWLTVTPDQYPPGLWPPRAGDVVTVVVPRVVGVGAC